MTNKKEAKNLFVFILVYDDHQSSSEEKQAEREKEI